MGRRTREGLLLAPGAASGHGALRAPGLHDRLPAVDESLLREDERAEIMDGVRIETSPAEEPHAVQHTRLDRLIKSCAAEGYAVAADMLTRTDVRTNFAPDVSVYLAERDPETGRRRPDELTFEVIDTTRLAEVTDKARRLVARGVRRVFVVDVNARSVREWSAAAGQWVVLAEDAVIEDRCLVTPVPVRALRDDLLADEVAFRAMQAREVPAVAQALVAREQQGHEAGVAAGRLEGLRAAVLGVLAARGLAVTDAHRQRVAACAEAHTLDRWLRGAATAVTADDALG